MRARFIGFDNHQAVPGKIKPMASFMRQPVHGRPRVSAWQDRAGHFRFAEKVFLLGFAVVLGNIRLVQQHIDTRTQAPRGSRQSSTGGNQVFQQFVQPKPACAPRKSNTSLNAPPSCGWLQFHACILRPDIANGRQRIKIELSSIANCIGLIDIRVKTNAAAASCLKAASLRRAQKRHGGGKKATDNWLIGRLIGNERITRRMALVEPVTGKFVDLIKNLTCFFLSTLLATAPSMKRFLGRHFRFDFLMRGAKGRLPSEPESVCDLHHLLLINHHAIGFRQ